MTKSWAVTSVLLAVGLVLTGVLSGRGGVQVQETRLDRLPMALGDWTGQEERFEGKVYRVLNADVNVLRRYRNSSGDFLWLYIGYYGTEKGGRTGHLPQHCYPGAGWEIKEWEKDVVSRPGGSPVRVNRLRVQRGGESRLALYWVHADKTRVLDSGWKMNVTRLVRRIASNRDDGAFVRISAPVSLDPEKTAALQRDFAAHLLRELPNHWPVEVSRPSSRSLWARLWSPRNTVRARTAG
jgi:EpsI family protein